MTFRQKAMLRTISLQESRNAHIRTKENTASISETVLLSFWLR